MSFGASSGFSKVCHNGRLLTATHGVFVIVNIFLSANIRSNECLLVKHSERRSSMNNMWGSMRITLAIFGLAALASHAPAAEILITEGVVVNVNFTMTPGILALCEFGV